MLYDINWKFILVYMDNIIIFSKSLQEYVEHLEATFERIRKARLKINAEKCNFCQESLPFLGHIITKERIRLDLAKIKKVLNFSIPHNTSALHSFLGLAGYYRKFVKSFSNIAHPLNHLLHKEVMYEWTDKQQRAFDSLKQKLIKAPTLKYPDMSRPFIL